MLRITAHFPVVIEDQASTVTLSKIGTQCDDNLKAIMDKNVNHDECFIKASDILVEYLHEKPRWWGLIQGKSFPVSLETWKPSWTSERVLIWNVVWRVDVQDGVKLNLASFKQQVQERIRGVHIQFGPRIPGNTKRFVMHLTMKGASFTVDKPYQTQPTWLLGDQRLPQGPQGCRGDCRGNGVPQPVQDPVDARRRRKVQDARPVPADGHGGSGD